MVVASGTSTRLVSSISQKLVDTLKTDHRRTSKVEGKDAGDWVLIFLHPSIQYNILIFCAVIEINYKIEHLN